MIDEFKLSRFASSKPRKRYTESNMVYVEGGKFLMGYVPERDFVPERDGEDSYIDHSKPSHKVELDSFEIGIYPVTNAQYASFLNAYGSDKVKKGKYAGRVMVEEHSLGVQINREGSWIPSIGYDNHPVVCVNWHGADQYCKWLSSVKGEDYRLPTESEWEYAARGGKMSEHSIYAGSYDLDEVAWYYDNSGSKTHPVGGKKANELGLYDMSGNVWEWCEDWYGPYPSSSQNNPTGPSSGAFRVNRGGSWYNSASRCHVDNRNGNSPDDKNRYLGFRIVKSLT